MMSLLSVGNLLFGILNFCILGFLIVYFLKKNLFALCMQEIEMQNQEELELSSCIDRLEDRCSELQQILKDERVEEQMLEQKIVFWATAVSNMRALKEQERLVLDRKLHEEMRFKENNYRINTICDAVMPNVISKVEVCLKERFNGDDRIAAYNKNIIAFMKKRANA